MKKNVNKAIEQFAVKFKNKNGEVNGIGKELKI